MKYIFTTLHISSKSALIQISFHYITMYCHILMMFTNSWIYMWCCRAPASGTFARRQDGRSDGCCRIRLRLSSLRAADWNRIQGFVLKLSRRTVSFSRLLSVYPFLISHFLSHSLINFHFLSFCISSRKEKECCLSGYNRHHDSSWRSHDTARGR